jgi:hypothetical protein
MDVTDLDRSVQRGITAHRRMAAMSANAAAIIT